jgi:hypothetical protein
MGSRQIDEGKREEEEKKREERNEDSIQVILQFKLLEMFRLEFN